MTLIVIGAIFQNSVETKWENTVNERRVLQLREFIYFYLNSDVAEPPWRGSYDAERQDTVVCG